ALKAGRLVSPAEALAVVSGGEGYASRGGHKLAAALDDFGVTVAGRHCLDAGASTGGFTDVLLRRGAARVVAVDVGYGQLDWRLRRDERVVVLDRTNVRHLSAADVGQPAPELVVADLSFISLRLALPALRAVATPSADLVALVKPQFEVGPQRVGKGGVVRDPQAWLQAVTGVVSEARRRGLGLAGAAPSMLPGPAGNVEFFVHLSAAGVADPAAVLGSAVEAGRALVPAGAAAGPGRAGRRP
ncbi:MAG TPA: TlyA family RNA methyltransferase, partial [Egibacteraceae bacterium]|nr:TlyA family RNA methyltransferase [Egibacteraceae bacterium]